MLKLILGNLLAFPIIAFLVGFLCSLIRGNYLFRPKLHSVLTYFLLFAIGFKGGGAFLEHSTPQFFSLLAIIVGWGFIQPFLSYWMLRKLTETDSPTAAAIAASFGSVSVMTFTAGAAFLEKLDVSYSALVIPVLALMEFPAIFSGLFISKWKKDPAAYQGKNIWFHTLFNHTILTIFAGIGVGMLFSYFELRHSSEDLLIFFKPCLALFLFNMGLLIGKERSHLHQFSWSLALFGLYTPLIGGAFGLVISYLFQLDPGTATLIAVLGASASYIAVPAVVRMAIPEAKEAIYLPLSLGIAFPFNILFGIPIYYLLALKFLT